MAEDTTSQLQLGCDCRKEVLVSHALRLLWATAPPSAMWERACRWVDNAAYDPFSASVARGCNVTHLTHAKARTSANCNDLSRRDCVRPSQAPGLMPIADDAADDDEEEAGPVIVEAGPDEDSGAAAASGAGAGVAGAGVAGAGVAGAGLTGTGLISTTGAATATVAVAG